MPKIDALFHEMPDRRASDLHLVVGRPPLFRVSGEMIESEDPKLSADDLKDLVYDILEPGQRETIETHLDLDFAYEVEDVARFRANIFYQQRGLGAVFRLIPNKIHTLQELGVPDSVR